MDTVVELRARRARSVVPVLAIAIALGGTLAACCLAIMLGLGVESEPAWTPWLLLIAALALAPTAWCIKRWHMLRPPARLSLGPETVTIAYPEILRTPLAVPRAVMRVAAFDDDGPERFRVHTASGPYWGGESDGFLWSRGATALPVLAPDGVRPNLLLLFEEPVAGADVRRSRLGALYRGERIVGLLLAARHAVQAQQAVVGLSRPLTMPDAILLEDHLNAEDGGRFALAERHLVRLSWALIAVGLIVPILAALGGAYGILLIHSGKRLHGAALALLGLGVFAVRLVLWLG